MKIKIKNMHCASCVKSIESALNKVNGVETATVNFADKSATIEGSISIDQIMHAIHAIGYEASVADETDTTNNATESTNEFKRQLKKSLAALSLGLPLFLIGFFKLIPPLTTLSGQICWVIIGILSLVVMLYSGGSIYKNAWRAFLHHEATMDTLITVGTGAAWIYSQFIAIFPHTVPAIAQHVYFEASLVILGLVNLGGALENRARGKTSEAIKHLIGLQPKTARIISNGKDYDVPIEQVKIDDLIRIRPGEKIPTDGVVTEGTSLIDESMISGEPAPVNKNVNDTVTGSTLNKTGTLIIKSTRVGEDTVLSQIIQLVQRAQNTKPPITKLADKVSSIFVPTVMILSIITALIWFNLGTHNVGYILVTAMSVLIIACPCALGLAAPISVMVGMGKGAQYGTLIRNGDALQQAAKLTTVVLDKTGTITKGHPELTDIIPTNNIDKNTLLQLAASLEKSSEHPLGQAVLDAAQAQNLPLLPTSDFNAIPGHGVKAIIEGHKIIVGNEKLLIQENIAIDFFSKSANDLSSLGKTPFFIAKDNTLIGMLAISDPIKADSIAAISRLKEKNIKVIMVTGDNEKTAKAVAKQVHIDEFYADVLPKNKTEIVKSLQKNGHITGMVGDGINDAPALSQADIGFAISSGTDIAIESADITLMRNSIHGVVDAIDISKATMRNIKQNLWGAFLYNSLGIPIAAGILFPFTGMLLNPMIAGAAMALSSLTVVTNANRLRLFHTKKE